MRVSAPFCRMYVGQRNTLRTPERRIAKVQQHVLHTRCMLLFSLPWLGRASDRYTTNLSTQQGPRLICSVVVCQIVGINLPRSAVSRDRFDHMGGFHFDRWACCIFGDGIAASTFRRRPARTRGLGGSSTASLRSSGGERRRARCEWVKTIKRPARRAR